jgi:hypothetical protein
MLLMTLLTQNIARGRNMNDIILFPLRGAYETEADVIEAWNNNADFRTPRERTAYMRKSDMKYMNPLDGVVYMYGDLTVTLKHRIV